MLPLPLGYLTTLDGEGRTRTCTGHGSFNLSFNFSLVLRYRVYCKLSFNASKFAEQVQVVVVELASIISRTKCFAAP